MTNRYTPVCVHCKIYAKQLGKPCPQCGKSISSFLMDNGGLTEEILKVYEDNTKFFRFMSGELKDQSPLP